MLDVTEDTSYLPPKLNVGSTVQKLIDSTKRYVVRVRIDRAFKGVAGKKVVIHTFQSDGPCSGLMLTEGKRYSIYAVRKEGQLGGLGFRPEGIWNRYNMFSFQLRARNFEGWIKFGVPYVSRTRVAAVKEKRPIVI